MRILITGSNGLLGQKLVKRCLKLQIPFVATSKGENRNPKCPNDCYSALDITSENDIKNVLEKVKPTAVIHTAAITNVDYCELNSDECFDVNIAATQKLFNFCKSKSIHFQLLSTDFVFDGEVGNYSENDGVNPLSVYATSKVNAEKILLDDNYPEWSIARTIIVYGTGFNLSRSNMILWALEALPKGETMRLVNDQFRAPTWADDLAYGCLEIVLRKQQGIFHLSGPVTRSIDLIVREIANILKLEHVSIETVSSKTLNQAALRPPKTGFNLSKATHFLDYKPKDFNETIPLLLQELAHLR
jgi:dTDP-4-dehydrorhamnose reductase